jgi:hypothetical protein
MAQCLDLVIPLMGTLLLFTAMGCPRDAHDANTLQPGGRKHGQDLSVPILALLTASTFIASYVFRLSDRSSIAVCSHGWDCLYLFIHITLDV